MSGLSTKTIHLGYTPNNEDGAIIPPLHLSTTFKFGNKGGFNPGISEQEWEQQKEFKFQNDYTHYDYARTVNPTRLVLEQVMADLDGNKFGLAYASGSAILPNLTALLQKGEGVLFSTDAYGGTYRYFVRVAGEQGIPFFIADLTNPNAAEAILEKHKTKLVWVETPTNPLLKVTDIKALAEVVHKYGAVLAVDNTFATPVLQSPAALGADIVAYSTTKYINGHSDSIGGVITLSDKEIYKKLKFLQNAIGAILSPFDSWLTLRGLKTLEVRMQRHSENTSQIIELLKSHQKIGKVFYPGSLNKEQAEIANRQMKTKGGMVSVELKPEYDISRFLSALKYFPLAESLGGVESLIDHPTSMTHSSIPKAEREKIGLTDGLFRISVGIENGEDLIADLKQALDRA